MKDLKTLLEEKAALEAAIAEQKPAAIAQVFALMNELGVTPADMGLAPAPFQPAKRAAAKRPARYRDADGNEWSGIGKRPNWVRAALAAGADLEAFRVRGEG